MITIRDLELKRTFIGGDYRRTKFQTTAEVQIGERYGSKTTLTLTDEQTDRAIAFIVEMIREGITVEMQKPEPIDEDIPALNPVSADTLESL